MMATCTDILQKYENPLIRQAVMATTFAQAPSSTRQPSVNANRRRLSFSKQACANLQREDHVALPAQAQHAQDINFTDTLSDRG